MNRIMLRNTIQRAAHLKRFYDLLGVLEHRTGGPRRLMDCSGRMDWPRRGVYFFREAGEDRSDTGSGPRVVRVGTHALKPGSRTQLWSRLSQHKGPARSGGGNHRGSVFRKHVGAALIEKNGHVATTWGNGSSASREVRMGELGIERLVSKKIGAMPFLWLSVDDAPGPDSQRGYVERNSIALLSNFIGEPIDPPSPHWLGRCCNRERVRRSGLWNSNHVDESCDPAFLDVLSALINKMEARS